MPEPQTNGSVNQMIHEEIEVVFRAHEKVREGKAHDEQIQKIREELTALKADNKEIDKIREELEALKEQCAVAATKFEIQKAGVAFWNKIEAILVPVLSAAVFALASWVWQSEGKIGNVELRVASVQTQIGSMESRTRSGTADRYTRTHAERDHRDLKVDLSLLSG